jgi:single-stranded-DNA-specific exonuclease
MRKKIKEAIEKISELSEKKPIKVISHFDTDGITSAAIFSRALQRWKKNFSLQITKSLDKSYIDSLPNDHILIFLDLASGSLPYLKEKKTDIFILDHHEVPHKEIPKNVFMINPLLENQEPISGAGICYLFAKKLSQENTDLATLAILGMVGDILDKNISKTYEEILKDSKTTIKKGILIYPSTRPLNKTLEYSTSPYIPNVTGSHKGVIKLLRDANIQPIKGTYKALYELTEEEMSNLITAIMLQSSRNNSEITNLIGNLYLVNFHNQLQDARELSSLINACSRMDSPEISLGFCLGNKNYMEKAEKIYIKYKQHLVSALKHVNEDAEKIKGKNYTIINTKNNVKDTIIGTVASIISHSPLYSEGNIIIALAYNEDKIKVSARILGIPAPRNVCEVLTQATLSLGGEVGGHPNAAGCLIQKTQESQFLQELQKVLEIEVVKI